MPSDRPNSEAMGIGKYAPVSDAGPIKMAVADDRGPDHYLKKGKNLLWNFLIAAKLGWCESNIIKYVFRWQDKGGLRDLEAARHYLDKLIETETDKLREVIGMTAPSTMPGHPRECQCVECENGRIDEMATSVKHSVGEEWDPRQPLPNGELCQCRHCNEWRIDARVEGIT